MLSLWLIISMYDYKMACMVYQLVLLLLSTGLVVLQLGANREESSAKLCKMVHLKRKVKTE